jgi:hypothetical protein
MIAKWHELTQWFLAQNIGVRITIIGVFIAACALMVAICVWLFGPNIVFRFRDWRRRRKNSSYQSQAAPAPVATEPAPAAPAATEPVPTPLSYMGVPIASLVTPAPGGMMPFPLTPSSDRPGAELDRERGAVKDTFARIDEELEVMQRNYDGQSSGMIFGVKKGLSDSIRTLEDMVAALPTSCRPAARANLNGLNNLGDRHEKKTVYGVIDEARARMKSTKDSAMQVYNDQLYPLGYLHI